MQVDSLDLSESRSVLEKEDSSRIIEIKDVSSRKKSNYIIGFLLILVLVLSITLGIVSYKFINNNNNGNNNNELFNECPESNINFEDSQHHVYNLAEYIHDIQNDLGVNMSFYETYEIIDDFLESFSLLSNKVNKTDKDTDLISKPNLLHEVPDILQEYDNNNNNNDDGTRRLQLGNSASRVCSNAYGPRLSNSVFYYNVDQFYDVWVIIVFYSTQINGICLQFLSNTPNNVLCVGSLQGNRYTMVSTGGFCQVKIWPGTNFIYAIQFSTCGLNPRTFAKVGGPLGNELTITPSGPIRLDAIWGYRDFSNSRIKAIGFCYSQSN